MSTDTKNRPVEAKEKFDTGIIDANLLLVRISIVLNLEDIVEGIRRYFLPLHPDGKRKNLLNRRDPMA